MNRLRLSVLLSALAGPLVADDREATTPTAWRVRTDQSTADIQQMSADGYRPIDVEVESTSPLRFTMTYVRNTGSYQKSWSMIYDKDFAELQAAINPTRRIVKLEPYVVNGQSRFAAIFVARTGADDKAWWYWAGSNLTSIRNDVAQRGARIIDFETYVRNGTTYYAVVAIHNSGPDNRQWSLHTDLTTAEIADKISETGRRVYDLERRSPGRYDIVLTRAPQPMSWWWYTGRTMAQLEALRLQNGARIFDVESYRVNGSWRYTALMIQNTNELTTRIGRELRTTTDGSTGFILKRLNGSTAAALQRSFRFDPASTLKQLHAVMAFRNILVDPQIGMTTDVTFRDGPCPFTTGPLVTEDLEQVVRSMLEASSNSRTDAIEQFFGGKNVLHAFADSIGMTDTRSNRRMGCSAPPYNTMTLDDIVTLHEWVANGALGSLREEFIDRMVNSRGNFPGTGVNYLGDLLLAERDQAGLTSWEYDQFESRFRLAYKPGAKTINGLAHRTTSGWAQIAFVVNNQVELREYAFGVFAHGASDGDVARDAISTAAHELLRDRIAAAMATWEGFRFGTFDEFGTSCGGTARAMRHDATGKPAIGQTANYRLLGGPPNGFATMWFALSNSLWAGNRLPLPLDFLGATGCQLYVAPIASVSGTTTTFGQMSVPMRFPRARSLIGRHLYTQFAVLAPGTNALGVTTTNGVDTMFGGTR